MNLEALLTDLKTRGVKFRVNGESVMVRPIDLLTEDEVSFVRAHKREIALQLTGAECPPVPIIEGTEHFNIWLENEDDPWPEFIPGYHYDFRQPSKLKGLCSNSSQPRRHQPLYLEAADAVLSACDRCGSIEYIDVLIHEGRSLRRDCLRCGRFMGWVRWCPKSE